MPLEWTQDLAVGIRQIDLQHQELIGIINELDQAQGEASQARALEEVLPRLSSYVLFHFGTEEAMMDRLPGPPPCVAKHFQEHQRFAGEVAALRGQNPSPAELAAFVDYLKRWIVEHIMKTDREMAAYLR
ncbi:MAG TPA: bacteriohemerythrin [Azospira sp.]|nr:bacteriohemerythrin [Azospira sp.]